MRSAGMWAGLLAGAVLALALGLFMPACGTVDIGDNIVPPTSSLDEDFFYCRIQPLVIVEYRCATGAAGDTGGCHMTQSALLLEDASAETAPACTDDGALEPGAVVPDVYMRNLDRVRFTVGTDPESSPFFRRPIGDDSHPRVIFDRLSPPADLIVEWILR